MHVLPFIETRENDHAAHGVHDARKAHIHPHARRRPTMAACPGSWLTNYHYILFVRDHHKLEPAHMHEINMLPN